MQWVINNVKMMMVLFILSVLLNIGQSAWMTTLYKRIDQMNHSIETLTNIAKQKEKAEENGRAADRKFFNAAPLPQGTGKGYNSSNEF